VVSLLLGNVQKPRMPCMWLERPFRCTLMSGLGYYQDMRIEWDPNKAKSNLRKDKVSFEEVATAVSDPLATI
jgi:hypothetical protein